jgi:hypothetical protein
VAQSPNSGEGTDVGAIYRIPPSPSLVASLDHTFLELCGEWHLRNPLRGNLHGGVCERGERRCCHGRPKRARSWKRRIAKEDLQRSGSPLLGEMSSNPTNIFVASFGRSGLWQRSPVADLSRNF